MGLFGFGRKADTQPRVPEDLRIYAVGDIHGRYDLLWRLNEIIMQDAAATPAPQMVQLFVGDYIDRGLDSRSVIDWLLSPWPDGFVRICLKGNHEAALLNFLERPETLGNWARFGGLETLYSYGVPLEQPDVEGREEELLAAFRACLPPYHIDFLKSLPLFAEFGDYYFVHAGVRPDIALEKQVEADQLWIRDEFLDQDHCFGKVIVHGHSTTTEPYISRNRINIDTAAYATGRLTCLVLEGDQQRFLTT